MDDKSVGVVDDSETLGRDLYRVARALCATPESASRAVVDALRSSGTADRIATFRALRKAIAKLDEMPESMAWRTLPPSERDALALRIMADLRQVDITSVLGVSEEEAQRRLASALGVDAAAPQACLAERRAWVLSGVVGEHGTECDQCRDYRHVAHTRIGDLRGSVTGNPEPAAEEAWQSAIEEHVRLASAPSEEATNAPAPEAPVLNPVPAPVEAARPHPPARRVLRGRVFTAAAIGSVILLGGGLLGYSALQSHRTAIARTVFHVDAIAPSSEHATVTESGKPAVPLAMNAELREGDVRTDGHGFVRFSQGEARYFLDRSSAITLSGDSVHLTDGALVVRDDKALSVRAGAAVVSGEGEAQLTVLPDRTHVRVLRGFADVTFQGRKERVEVGQEGLLRDGHMEVASASGPSLRLAESKEAEAERPLVGLGELIARKPGSKDEKDGAVVLRKHSVKTRIAGAMARTEIEEEFENKTDEVLEGVVRFPLPPGAVLERLALDVDGTLVDGEFVERKRAAAIFTGAIQTAVAKPILHEDIIWVPGPWRDPALLEWQRAGRFELRIFPIAKRSVRRVVMAYTETVPLVAGERQYSYPMPRGRNLKVPTFSADIKVVGYDDRKKPRVRGYDLAERSPGQYDGHYEQFQPEGDLTVSYETPDQKAQVSAVAFTGAREGQEQRWVTLSLRPTLPRVKDAAARDQVIVVDVGRGMYGERFERARKLVGEVIGNMDRRDRVTVLACDTTCKQLRAGFVPPGLAAVNDAASFLGDLRPDGASDMAAAALAATHANGHDAARPLRVTLLSAGAATAGYREPNRLARLVSEQVGEKAQVVTVAVTPDADATALEAIARAGGGVFVTYAPARLASEVARDILDASYGSTLRNVELVLPEGLTDVAPAKVASLRGGTETLVAAKMLRGEVNGDVVLRGTIGGAPFEAKYPMNLVATSSEDRAFVPRVYASLRIKDVGGDRAHEQEVVKLSKLEHVPAPQTSLLVLESETMFKAFGIDRTKQANAWDTDHAPDAALALGKGAGEAASSDTKSTDHKEDFDPGDPYYPGPHGGGSGGASGGFRGDGFGPAPAAPTKRSADSLADIPRDLPAPKAGSAPAPLSEFAEPPSRRLPPPLMDRPRPPTGRWMRRTWQRSATIQDGARSFLPSERDLDVARHAVDVAPDARGNYVKLARLLARHEEDAELRTLLGRWEQKDPFDLGLIGQRAEYLLRKGDRAEALRVQAGALAAPSLGGEAASQSAVTLARAYERLGQDGQACSFWRSAFELRPQDDEVAARAMRCDRNVGLHVAEDVLRGGGRDFGKLERLAANSMHASQDDASLGGDFRIDARWDVSQDLDIAIVLPSGERITWATRGARSRSVASTHEESLAYSKWFAGGATIEIGPGGGVASDRTPRPVRGTLTVHALGQVREVPFVVEGAAKAVARINVAVEEILVPTSQPASFQNWRRSSVVF